jgi:diadenosine tetraphosphate (Ap4A) HIT family hydrolase
MPSPVDQTQDPDFIDCSFCRRLSVGHFLFEDDSVIVFRDAYPVTPGHVHIVPRRHQENFLDLSAFERDAMWDALDQVRGWLEDEHRPSGLNIGINIGPAAGQTVPHANIHVIPRYPDDGDRNSGVRWVLGGEGAEYSDRRRKCGFCQQIENGETLTESELSVGIPDLYPITEGHSHALPRRHVETIFDLSVDERDELWATLDLLVADLEERLSPDGYNIGMNIGQAAGQSTEHANVHLVPRFVGDVDEANGIRWVAGGQGADYRSGRH